MTLLILGAGQYGLAARDIAIEMGIFSNILFLDDNNSELAIGKLDCIDSVEHDLAFVAVGDPVLRAKLYEKVGKPATLISPEATVMASAVIGAGTIIEAGAIVSSNAHVGRGCIVMASAVVGHNAHVEDFCQLKYNCVIAEGCLVPAGTKVESNVSYHGPENI